MVQVSGFENRLVCGRERPLLQKKKSEDAATVFSLVMAVSVGEPGKGYFHGHGSGTAPHGEM